MSADPLNIAGLVAAALAIAGASFICGALFAAHRFESLEDAASHDEGYWND